MSHAFFRSIFRVLPLLLVLSPVNSSGCAMGNRTAEIRVKYENILSHDIDELVNTSAEYRDRCCKNKKHDNSKVFFCNDTQELRLAELFTSDLRALKVIVWADLERLSIFLDNCQLMLQIVSRLDKRTDSKTHSLLSWLHRLMSLQPWLLPNALTLLLLLLQIDMLNILKRWQEVGSLQTMACHMLRFFHKQKIGRELRRKAALVSCGTLQVLQCRCERLRKEKVCMQVNTYNREDTETGEQSKKKCNQEFCELKENISSLRSCWNKFEKIISR